ncbi:MAG: T9SS type A sorting domain-containing protein [Fidelibacterota bacterium]|nr:MAG: T9SS type A sorting domain-containing protein [Candidatus Neomarinimicrobiota bacterium]
MEDPTIRRVHSNPNQRHYTYTTKSISRFAMLGIIFVLAPASVCAQFEWTHTNQPVLGYGSDGQWDNYSAGFPVVIKDGDTLRMWYGGSDVDIDAGGTANIGYAFSLDGISWNRYPGNPVMSAELVWEGGHVYPTAVIKDGDILKMWYAGSISTSWPVAIGYATSVDGINWNRRPDPVFQAGPSQAWDSEIGFMNIIKDAGSGYKMWYSGRAGYPSLIQIGLATSIDGIHWAKYDNATTTGTLYAESDPVLKVGGSGAWDYQRVFGPAVLPTDTGYEMWYAGAWYPSDAGSIQVVGYATSADGISWTKWLDNPVIRSYPEWGHYYITGTALKLGGFYHLWYMSLNSEGKRMRIGYATSDTSLIAIEDHSGLTPSTFSLHPAYPNPFNPMSTIRYDLPQTSNVSLIVYDILGREITRLLEGYIEPGYHQAQWDGKDQSGRSIPSGIYIARMTASEYTKSIKMVLLK